MRRRTYTGFVTARPAREVASKDEPAITILQELSAAKPVQYVPQEDTDVADRVRALMLYDAALTPPDMPGAYGIPSWALDTARLMRAEPYVKHLKTVKPTGAAMAEHERALQQYIQAGKGAWKQWTAAMRRMSAAYGDEYVPFSGHKFSSATGEEGKRYQCELTTWDDVVEFARKLADDASGEQQVKQPGQNGKGDDGEDGDPGEGEAPVELGQFEDDDAGEQTGNVWSNDPWAKGGKPNKFKGGVDWGILANATRPDVLPMVNFRKPGIARRRSELEGCVPTRWHRLLTDGKLFKGAPMRGKSKGRGTILVDMSGSMSWDYDSFKRMLEVVPECSVYGYSGEYNLTKGRLVLLADRGRCADMRYVEKWREQKGANLVDGPALLFLAKMPGPRLWISDGHVTGKHEHRSHELVNHAQAICDAGNIKRVRQAELAADVLSGKRPGDGKISRA